MILKTEQFSIIKVRIPLFDSFFKFHYDFFVLLWQTCPLLIDVVMSTGRYATLCIRENPGCLFIATNRDAVGPVNNLQEGPGSLFKL